MDNNLGNNRTNYNINMYYRINKNINKNRCRNIIWLKPPFHNLSNIDIGKYFLDLLNKHFKDYNHLRKIIDKNKVKFSYSCTNNISKIIDNQQINKQAKLEWKWKLITIV